MKTAKSVILRKCTDGYYALLPSRTLLGMWVNIDNMDVILSHIYEIEHNYVGGYKTLAGARKKILSLLSK